MLRWGVWRWDWRIPYFRRINVLFYFIFNNLYYLLYLYYWFDLYCLYWLFSLGNIVILLRLMKSIDYFVLNSFYRLNFIYSLNSFRKLDFIYSFNSFYSLDFIYRLNSFHRLDIVRFDFNWLVWLSLIFIRFAFL